MKTLCVSTLLLVGACAHSTVPTPAQGAPEAPARFEGLIGEYAAPTGERLVLEDSGRLYFADTLNHRIPLAEQSSDRFALRTGDARSLLGLAGDVAVFHRNSAGYATSVDIDGHSVSRMQIEPVAGGQLQVKPVRPVEEVRREALTQSPPQETGSFRPADLVELTSLDPTIKLEIRYATTNNFLGTRFYEQARAFMQRPAAEAVVRANKSLAAMGYGLLVHDAYRPWYVTKMFWDATPLDKRWLVANPASGSKHNRGAAVDLTLYELKTGRAVVMPSTYDESTDRAHADYPGGTAAQRWRRAVLRKAMEAEGFAVIPNEWWHFDYKDWRQYAIGNIPFENIR